MFEFGLIDWLVCFGYLAIVIGLAVRSVKGQQNNQDYFVGGRKMNWIVVGISMFATSFSSISFLGLPQRGAYQDFSFYLVYPESNAQHPKVGAFRDWLLHAVGQAA